MSLTTESVNTKKVEGRRKVRYASLDEFLADAERLAYADVRTIGNWSRGQIYMHLAQALNMSIDGGPLLPAPARWILTMLFKNKFVNDSLPAGFKAPGKFVPPETISVEAGLSELRQACQRQGETSERAMHPGFGKITREEWDRFHLRHAEMHMSFIVE